MTYQLWLGDCLQEMDRIICGDSALVMAQFPDNCIDLTVTSPPYDNLRTYNGFTFDFEAIAGQLWRVTKPGGVVVWVVGDATKNGSESLTSFKQALYFRELGFNVETMIYKQMGTGAKGSNYYYWQAFEFMFVLSKGQPRTSNRIADHKNVKAGCTTGSSPKMNNLKSRTERGKRIVPEYSVRQNVWAYPAHKGEKTDHPAPFPEALAHDHIISWSNPGDVVLDPMCGSGTTLKMAMLTGRKYLGIDISAEYCELTRNRLEQVTKRINNQDLPLFAGGNQ
jgi:DNA modification methylase